MARFGAAGRPVFDRLLADPTFEAHSGSTGTAACAWAGARRLGVELTDLFSGVRRAIAAGEDASHAMRVLVALLRMRLFDLPDDLDGAPTPPESFGALEALFSRTTEQANDSLSDLATRDDRREVNVLRYRLALLQWWELALRVGST